MNENIVQIHQIAKNDSYATAIVKLIITTERILFKEKYSHSYILLLSNLGFVEI